MKNYLVVYSWKGNGMFCFGNAYFNNIEKLNEKAIDGMRDWLIKNGDNIEQVVFLNFLEIEG